MTIRSQMSSIMDLIGPEMRQMESEHPQLFALESGKTVEPDFVYTPASTNIDQAAPNLVKLYVTIKS